MNAMKITVFFFLLANLALAESSIFDSDIHIISSDESGITFTYYAPDLELTSLEGYPSQYKFPSMPRTAQVRDQGKPMLPVKIIPIGAPFSSKPTVTIVSQNYSRIAEVEIPNFISEFSEKEFIARTNNQKPYKTWPLQTVSIEDEYIIRGLRVVKVNLGAARIENGILYKAQSITVRVDFNNPTYQKTTSPRPNGYIFDNLLSNIVVNYDIARNWRVHWPPIPFKTQATQSVFDSSQVWVKLEVTGSAVYRITRFELSAAGVDVDDIDPREIRIFYGGGAELPVNNDQPRPEFVEVPIYVTGYDDGAFDDGDLLLFYGEAADRYEYDNDLQEFIFHYNHYTPKNIYWLTYSGSFGSQPKRWANINGSPQSQYNFAVDKFTDFVHQEREIELYAGTSEYRDHFEWYWGKKRNFSANIRLNDVVAGSAAKIKVYADGSFDQLLVNNTPAARISYSNGFSIYNTSSLYSGTSFNTFILSNDSEFYLDYIDIFYPRWLTLEDNELRFTSPDSAGIVEYRLTNVPSDYILLNISHHDSTARIINAELSGDTLVFHDANDAKYLYYIVGASSYKTINSYSIYEPDDLRSTSNGADYIIITPEVFYEQSLELAEHRENVSANTRVKVVRVEDIYNQFSWGLFDPIAIRDFLKYTFENWAGAPPSYVVLVGDGHYDYRNNLNSGGQMLIPPFETNFTPSNYKSYGSDECFIYFGGYGYLDSNNDESLDMIIGRLSANNTDEMEIVLNKIINYEANPTMGKWRNNVIIVADDHLKPGSTTEVSHTNQAESLAGSHVPNSIEVKKIYLMEYPVKTGNTKPDAREALINAFNDGGLIVNWIGHGNKGQWAHEVIFRRVEDIPLLQNTDKPSLVFAASCSIGFFDHPTEQGMSEDFLRYANGGAIASIGATRLVQGAPNAQLNYEMYDQLLFGDSVSFGGALYIAKYLRQVNGSPITNDRKYMLFGDPALIAGKPTLEVEFSHWPDSLTGLTVDSIAGTVVNDSGEPQTNFNGTIWVLAKDASINRHRMLTNYAGNPTTQPPTYFDYTLPGPTIFYGPALIENGHFSTSFFIPKDISYGEKGAKIYVYFENGIIDGSGVTDTLQISGAISAEVDSVGPTIDIFYKNQNLNEGIMAVSTDAVFEARVYDAHGVNITGAMGHGIVVKIDDGDAYSADLTENFVFDMGDWQQGSVTFEINDLPVGEHMLTLKAWDNYNNSTLFTSYINVYEAEQFSISEVMNYPNPAVRTNSTVFQYLLKGPAESVSLEIYTLAGRNVKSLDLLVPDYTLGDYSYKHYNLRDADGDKLASGVYIYKIEAFGTGLDGNRRKSSFQSKLVIFR